MTPDYFQNLWPFWCILKNSRHIYHFGIQLQDGGQGCSWCPISMKFKTSLHSNHVIFMSCLWLYCTRQLRRHIVYLIPNYEITTQFSFDSNPSTSYCHVVPTVVSSLGERQVLRKPEPLSKCPATYLPNSLLGDQSSLTYSWGTEVFISPMRYGSEESRLWILFLVTNSALPTAGGRGYSSALSRYGSEVAEVSLTEDRSWWNQERWRWGEESEDSQPYTFNFTTFREHSNSSIFK